MKHKPFKTYDEQIELLRNKGLTINNPDIARKYLSELNYYRLSGYSLVLRKDDRFYPSTCFEDIIEIYHFDKELKNILLGYLEDIEISLRSHIAYELGRLDLNEDETVSYLCKENFASEEHFERFMHDLSVALRDNQHEAFVKHHETVYSGVLPVWAMVETLSFGSASRLIHSLSIPLQKQICATWYPGLRYTTITNWLEGLVVLRNICAHHARLFNRGFVLSPSFSPEAKEKFEKYGYERNQVGKKLFFRLVVIARMSPLPNITEKLISDISDLSDRYPGVQLKHYGFLKKWKEILREATAI